MNAQEYNLNIRPGYGYSQTVKVSQDDIGRPLEFHLYDGMDLLSITVGSVITIHATKPSGLGFTETCTWSGSTASISTTESMTQESGAFPAELVITSGDDVLGTANFTFCVERSPHQTGTTDGVVEDLQDIYEQLDDLKEEISELGGLSDDVKQALLQIASKVQYIDGGGATYYSDLYNALYPLGLDYITAEYTQSGTVYDIDNINTLKSDLVVTAHWDNGTTSIVPSADYTLSGTLEVGTSTVTVTYMGKTTTFTVTVTYGEILFISGYSPNNSSSSGPNYTPFGLSSRFYTYDYTKKIVSIRVKVKTAGTLSIGHIPNSALTVGASASSVRSALTVDEVFTISGTGEKKLTLTNPIELDEGDVLTIGNTTDTCVFYYGTYGTDKGFTSITGQSILADQTASLGIDVYYK